MAWRSITKSGMFDLGKRFEIIPVVACVSAVCIGATLASIYSFFKLDVQLNHKSAPRHEGVDLMNPTSKKVGINSPPMTHHSTHRSNETSRDSDTFPPIQTSHAKVTAVNPSDYTRPPCIGEGRIRKKWTPIEKYQCNEMGAHPSRFFQFGKTNGKPPNESARPSILPYLTNEKNIDREYKSYLRRGLRNDSGSRPTLCPFVEPRFVASSKGELDKQWIVDELRHNRRSDTSY